VSYFRIVLSLSLLAPSLAFTSDAPTIRASSVPLIAPPSSTILLGSVIPGQNVTTPGSATLVQESSVQPLPVLAPVTAPAILAPAAASAAKPAPNLGVESCRNHWGFYGVLAGAGAGLIIQHNNHDSLSIVYGLLGGWALGELVSLFICD